jgi:hypothetical protein
MRLNTAQYPLIADVEIRPLQAVGGKPQQKIASQSRPVDREQVMAYVTKSVVIVSCLTMMYGMMSYGRIFENYLQW